MKHRAVGGEMSGKWCEKWVSNILMAIEFWQHSIKVFDSNINKNKIHYGSGPFYLNPPYGENQSLS